MNKNLAFFIFLFLIVFSAGFLTGYFLERAGIIYTKNELENLRNEIENMQIQEMFIAGENVDCRLLFSTMGKVSYDLYDLVKRLKDINPESPQFYSMKKQADFLSLKAWIIARSIQEKCTKDIVPVLYFYSPSDCKECVEQDEILQRIKQKYNQTLVYAVDYTLNEPAINLVKAAYEIKSVPSMIINHRLYGKLNESEIENIICQQIECER